MILVRRIGAIILGVAAIAVFFIMAPDNASEISDSSDVSRVLANDDLNQSNASGAPQQAVVNGWVARDLLEVIARDQLENKQVDHRPSALLLLGLLLMVLYVVTSESRAKIPSSSHGAAQSNAAPTRNPDGSDANTTDIEHQRTDASGGVTSE